MWGPRTRSGGASVIKVRVKVRAAAALAAALTLAACRSEQGSPYRCDCSFLTDYDDAATIAVRSCAPSRDLASTIARGCAQSGAPAPVDKCSCEPDAERAGEVCRVSDCAVIRP
jgi:hypothetical protein